MKALIGLVNRLILAFGVLLIFAPVYFAGGMDHAPQFLQIITMLSAIAWFGAYLFGYQKIYKNLTKPKNDGTLSKTLNTPFAPKDNSKPMHRFETSGEIHLPIEDVNTIGKKETFLMRLKLVIVIAIIVLIYTSIKMNKVL